MNLRIILDGTDLLAVISMIATVMDGMKGSDTI